MSRSVLVRYIVLVLMVIILFGMSELYATPINIDGSTELWTVVNDGTENPVSDPLIDQQTGSYEADLVADANHALFYTQFDSADSGSLTDGNIAFRVRLGGDADMTGFKGAFFVGLDADNNGSIDLFVGVNNSGGSDQIGIWDPGTGANTGPSTTTIVSTPLVSYSVVLGTNYDFSKVSAATDPSATNYDLDGQGPNPDKMNDRFLSFSIDFNDIVTQLANNGISGFNEESAVRYVLGTATQANSLNQDIGGINGGTDSTLTYDALGAFTSYYTPTGDPPADPPPRHPKRLKRLSRPRFYY